MREEAEEVLHDEAEGVFRYDGILDVGDVPLSHLQHSFGEVLVVGDEVERRHFIDIAVEDEVNEARELMPLVTFVVNHNGLEEGVVLVEWQEPVADALHVLTTVQQWCLGKVGVQSSLKAFSQVTSFQFYDGLDAVEVQRLLAGDDVFGECLCFLHFLLHVLLGNEHEEHLVLYLVDEGASLA